MSHFNQTVAWQTVLRVEISITYQRACDFDSFDL